MSPSGEWIETRRPVERAMNGWHAAHLVAALTLGAILGIVAMTLFACGAIAIERSREEQGRHEVMLRIGRDQLAQEAMKAR
jgi:uncharacterized membrane protein